MKVSDLITLLQSQQQDIEVAVWCENMAPAKVIAGGHGGEGDDSEPSIFMLQIDDPSILNEEYDEIGSLSELVSKSGK